MFRFTRSIRPYLFSIFVACGAEEMSVQDPGITAAPDGGSLSPDGRDPKDPPPIVAIDCPPPSQVRLAASGLPLIESNPGAAVALFLDFDGGSYDGSAGPERYRGYSRDSDYSTFTKQEQDDIIGSVKLVNRYFAMFDVNVTTEDAVRTRTGKWGWVLITEDASGGKGILSSRAIGTPSLAMAYAGASSVRGSDQSRRIAHELGHTFQLEHSGVWDKGVFYKWEDWPTWDRVYGPIMGGGGLGQRVGWAYGRHEGDPDTLQDEMDIIRRKIIAVAGGIGWRKDDFPETSPAPLCKSDTALYRDAVLERPDDRDVFAFSFAGGDLTVEAVIPPRSSALVNVKVLSGDREIGGTGTIPALPPGNYHVQVTSRGGYAEIGEYTIRIRPPAMRTAR